MALYYSSAKVIGRSAGRSAVAAAAYRAAELMHDERLDQEYDYTAKAGVVRSETTCSRRRTRRALVERWERLLTAYNAALPRLDRDPAAFGPAREALLGFGQEVCGQPGGGGVAAGRRRGSVPLEC